MSPRVGTRPFPRADLAEGRAYAQQVESTAKLVKDPVVTEYVNRIGQNLVHNSDAKVPFTIKVIDSDEINAFALPGGMDASTSDAPTTFCPAQRARIGESVCRRLSRAVRQAGKPFPQQTRRWLVTVVTEALYFAFDSEIRDS